MPDSKKDSKTAIVITAIICVTLLIAGGIGSLVYVNEKNRTQQKELREKEISAENERAQKQRELEDEKSRRDCRAQAQYAFSCL